jgi:hypothetical protein
MSVFATCRRSARVLDRCGLVLALAIVAGCGPKTPPPAPVKPKTEAPKADAAPVVQSVLSDEYTSVFEDLLPPKGKDPFFPTSHRRDPVPVATPTTDGFVDPVLVLKSIIHSSKHSQAVINNAQLEVGEEESVRVPNGKVRVRCLEIGNDFVRVQVQGEAEPKILMMQQKK